MIPSPVIDRRSRRHIYGQLTRALQRRLDIDALDDPLADALLQIFSRYGEHLIQRLNQVPDRNFLYFLDLLNISRRPPLPARAPLTFTAVKRLPAGQARVVVPAGTRVAAPPPEGRETPVVYETREDLHITDWRLKRILVADQETNRWDDISHLADPAAPAAGRFAFRAGRTAVQAFYIAHAAIFSQPHLRTLTLSFRLRRPPDDRSNYRLDWRLLSPDGAVPLIPETDTTRMLHGSGDIVFRNLPDWPASEVHGRRNHWLECRLWPDSATEGFLPPAVDALTLMADWAVPASPPADAFFNATALDLTMDFYPLGQAPRFGDVFYLNCPTLALAGACVEVTIKLTNPASARGPLPVPPVNNQGRAEIQWECWCHDRWRKLTVSDGTRALTEDGVVGFTLPGAVTPLGVQGIDGHWLRARLVGGHYGYRPPALDMAASSPEAISPPVIQTLSIGVTRAAGPVAPETILARNNLVLDRLEPGSPFRPYHHPREGGRAIYFGFEPAPESASVPREMDLDLYVHVGGSDDRLCFRSGGRAAPPVLNWQYYDGRSWCEVLTRDGSAAFTRSGRIHIRVPGEMAVWDQCAEERRLCWLRAVWESGDYGCRPHIRRVLLNTAVAEHAMTIDNEILGSSNGRPSQRFQTARAPLLEMGRLEVREPASPSADRPGAVHPADAQAVTVVKDAHDRIEQIWVRWDPVDDFMDSDRSGRHFTVDYRSGAIRFGDGRNGKIPPAGSNNIRITRYRTGGGRWGNQPADTITQLRTSVPFIASVRNPLPASGGQDIESEAQLKERGAAELRHRRRAVTREDYEDLAKAAVANIARAKCIPNRDLAADPDGGVIEPAIASLVVVPRDPAPRPVPDLALLQRIAGFLEQRKAADTELVLLEPEYVCMDVEAVVIPLPSASGVRVAQRCQAAVNAFLHPTSGGSDGEGWPFGRRPNDSDLLGLLDPLEGVDRIERLETRMVASRPGLLNSGLFLICPGKVNIIPGFGDQ